MATDTTRFIVVFFNKKVKKHHIGCKKKKVQYENEDDKYPVGNRHNTSWVWATTRCCNKSTIRKNKYSDGGS